MPGKRTGDVLVERGSLLQEDLVRALAMQREQNSRLGEILHQQLRLPKSDVGKAVEHVQGVKYVSCPPAQISPEALALIPRALAIRFVALPLVVENNVLIVAVAEPQDLRVLDELRLSAGMPISPRFSFREDITAGIRKFYVSEGGFGFCPHCGSRLAQARELSRPVTA